LGAKNPVQKAGREPEIRTLGPNTPEISKY
jgi:hypothetical protein